MKGKSRIQLVLWALLFVVTMSFSAYGADGQIKIGQTASTTFPIWINQPGSYVLTSNIVIDTSTSAGILINTDNVTLDLNGHSIIGPGKESIGVGIYAHSKNNIVIMNGTIRDFGKQGIYLAPGTYSTETTNQIKDINVYNNGSFGIGVYGASLINSCTAVNNGCIGIFAESGSITNCVASRNGNGGGIQASDSSITDCTATSNDGSGFIGVNCVITNCSARNNVSGFSARESNITNCTVYQTSSYGFDANSCVITNCSAILNGGEGPGFQAEDSFIINCRAEGSRSAGLRANRTAIVNFTSYGNGSHGINAIDSCRIDGSNLRSNGYTGSGYGLYISGSHNYAIKNVANNNGSGNFYTDNPSDNYMPILGDNANHGF